MGLDVIATAEAGRNESPDEEQLRFAAEEGRVLVTRNYDDFSGLTLRFEAEGTPHAGVLFVSPSLTVSNFGEVARAIAQYDRDHPDGIPPYMADIFRRRRS